MSPWKDWLSRLWVVIPCTIGVVLAVIFGTRIPWLSWAVTSSAVSVSIVMVGLAGMSFLLERRPGARNAAIAMAAAVGFVSAGSWTALLLMNEPWAVDDPTSPQLLQEASAAQLRRLVDALAIRLREQEAIDQGNEADLSEEAENDFLRNRAAHLTPAQTLARGVARVRRETQAYQRRQNYFDQHFRSQFKR